MTALAHTPETQTRSDAALFDSLYDSVEALEKAALHLLNRHAALSESDPERQDIDTLRNLLDAAHELIANATNLAITRLT
ncbi:Uncharacterised protein [Mycobacteroides abscessus subsp. massiliense]|uniref:hypothetical protein n=1 Tax=Mycobacteroides abscessus TaxID=36809 RepID=UPI0009A8B3F1|nr:hypothetical protein [Mycobacteroides abscessus]SKF34752.1 Uncharacterised protein [Mycobacteroides abscessus subsp. massiliense]SKF44480.1 Uncharacterised protein [Mycobacteroides abscessus subsp. massiliense]SKF46597.1 Uncharacterised protein [Mycobacteroides abscessus subsp. massiliense]SKF48858.1 Uncharacterised protein [Mycobacteroides abscessus subsp. massiliense]SKF49099.1 Uncharacterised protein [Mycobacteroides abscessus subsp. massiliense]